MVGKTSGKADAASNSIVQHRHFPVIVALWFAALFGLGSLAIRPALLESAVLSMRIDTVIAAAAPPLGMTARLLLALIMGGLGATIGLILARKIAAPRETGLRLRARDAHPDAPARRPLSAATELAERAEPAAETTFETAAPMRGQRRRTLAISEDSYPTEIIDFAPLPGAAPFAAPAPLDLGDLALSEDDALVEPDTVMEALPEPVAQPRAFDPPAPLAPEPAPAFTAADVAPAPEPDADTVAAPGPAEAAILASPLGALSLVQLSTRLAAALASRRSRLAASTAIDLTALIRTLAPAAHRDAPAAAAAEDEASTPLAEWQPDSAAISPEQPGEDYTPAPRLFGALPAGMRPVAAEYDADEDDHALADARFAPPLRGLARQPAADAADDMKPIDPRELTHADAAIAQSDDSDAADDAEGDDSYSSLLDISVSALSRPGHVRIDDQPAAQGDAVEPSVVFPGQLPRFAALAATRGESDEAAPAPPASGLRRFDPAGTAPRSGTSLAPGPVPAASDPEATERALRSALATLQRMSGAA